MKDDQMRLFCIVKIQNGLCFVRLALIELYSSKWFNKFEWDRMNSDFAEANVSCF